MAEATDDLSPIDEANHTFEHISTKLDRWMIHQLLTHPKISPKGYQFIRDLSDKLDRYRKLTYEQRKKLQETYRSYYVRRK